VLLTAIVDALMAIKPQAADREAFMALMGKTFDAYHNKGKRSLQ
jgi:hypothetical protein